MAPPFTYVLLPKFLDVPRGFREPFPFEVTREQSLRDSPESPSLGHCLRGICGATQSVSGPLKVTHARRSNFQE